MDILLVIGPIVAAQYESVVTKMREQGMHPVIVRIGEEFVTDGDFYDAASNAHPSNLSESKGESFDEDWIEAKKNQIIDAAFIGKSIKDVKGVVIYASHETASGNAYMAWLFDRLIGAFDEHLVFVGEDCSSWVESSLVQHEPSPGD